MGSDFSAWLFLCGRKCHANCKDIAIRCVAFSGGVEATSSSFCQRLSKFQNRVTVCEMTFFHAAATLPGIMKSYEILPYTSPTLDFQLRSILHLRRSTPEFYRFSSFFFVKNREVSSRTRDPTPALGLPSNLFQAVTSWSQHRREVERQLLFWSLCYTSKKETLGNYPVDWGCRGVIYNLFCEMRIELISWDAIDADNMEWPEASHSIIYHISMHVSMHIFIFLHYCVCVCVCRPFLWFPSQSFALISPLNNLLLVRHDDLTWVPLR